MLPYVRDLPQLAVLPDLQGGRAPGVLGGVFGPLLRSGADTLDRVLGGATSVRRRLERANLAMSVHDFRVEQVLWGLAAFAVAAALSLVVVLRSPGRAVPLLILCCVAFVLGALLRENRLTTQVRERERRILAEFPAIAEPPRARRRRGRGTGLRAGAGRHPLHGELSADLSGVLAAVGRHAGRPCARRDGRAVRPAGGGPVRRGDGGGGGARHPLTDVLHAQAADVRGGRRALIESGARKEVLMMVPVVFLVLPVTVLFAFWPGVVGLRLVTP